MLTYVLEKTKENPLYNALYQAIRKDIESGALVSGSKLPSKRNLAKHLHIGVTTVENAYAQLMVEGYIYAIEKKGYFVSALDFIPQATKIILEETIAENPKTDVLDLKSNAIPAKQFPFSVWAKLARNVLNEEKNLFCAMPYNGTAALRQAIAEHLYTYRALSVSPEQIVIGAGTETLYQYLISFLGRDRIYGVENPGYHNIVKMYDKAGITCRFANIDKEGVTIGELEKKNISVIHISPSHHFPTGIVMPISRRSKLLEWAKKGRYIIEDEYDSEFRFVGKPIPTLMSIDQNDRVIYVNTFSKTISPAIRISYMVLPKKLSIQYKKEMGFYSCTVSAFEQHTLARFIQDGYFEKHINRMKTYYKNQRDLLISAFMRSKLGTICKIEEANSGLHFLIRLQTDKTDREIEHLFKEAGVEVCMLSAYTVPRKDTHALVVNYTGTDLNFLPNAIQKINKMPL